MAGPVAPRIGTFSLVYVDGELADAVEAFEHVATSVFGKPVEVTNIPNPPHTFGDLGAGAGLTVEESASVRRVVGRVADYWLHNVPRLEKTQKLPAGDVVFVVVDRIHTSGMSVLQQTIRWLEREHIAHSPIVWVK